MVVSAVSIECRLNDEAGTLAVAKVLAGCLEGRGLVFLQGQLGAGKTTFCRGILRGMGHEGAVKSPTFTLVEPYKLGQMQIFHFDLYRLGDPNELEYIGVDDYLDGQNLCLVEWPERAEGFLPEADLVVRLEVDGDARRLTIGAHSDHGETVVRRMRTQLKTDDSR